MIRRIPYFKIFQNFLFTLFLITPGWSFGQNSCPKINDLSATDIGETSAQLNWVASSEHKSFDISVMHGSQTGSFKFSATIIESQRVVDGLEAGSNYRFQVKAKCEKGSSTSKWFDFTTAGDKASGGGNGTGNGGGNTKCPDLEGVAAVDVTDTSATFTWMGDPAYVDFKVDVMHAPQNANFKWSDTTLDTAITADNLNPGRSYRFKVTASCDKGKSSSGWTTFSTTGIDSTGHGRCPKATNLAVLDVTDTSVVLSWLGNPENVEYQVDVHQKEHTASFKLSETVDTTALEVTGLEPGGNYKFRVKASCDKNSAGSSSWINFVTTGGDDTTFSQCPKPRNLSVIEVTDTSALLAWIALDTVESFDLEVKSFEQTPSFRFDTTLADTFYLVTGLAPEGNYHFRLKANCSDTSSSGSSDWSKFRTLADTSSSVTEGEEPGSTVELEAAESQVTTFPNPVEEELTVVLPTERLGYLTYIVLSDLSGRVVYETKLEAVPTDANLPIPVQGLTSGIYKLAINSIGFSETKTILIQARQ